MTSTTERALVWAVLAGFSITAWWYAITLVRNMFGPLIDALS